MVLAAKDSEYLDQILQSVFLNVGMMMDAKESKKLIYRLFPATLPFFDRISRWIERGEAYSGKIGGDDLMFWTNNLSEDTEFIDWGAMNADTPIIPLIVHSFKLRLMSIEKGYNAQGAEEYVKKWSLYITNFICALLYGLHFKEAQDVIKWFCEHHDIWTEFTDKVIRGLNMDVVISKMKEKRRSLSDFQKRRIGDFLNQIASIDSTFSNLNIAS